MTRTRRIDVAAPAEPAGGFAESRRPSPLDDVSNAGHRAILEAGGLLALAPQWLCDAGGYVVACRWTGQAFKVFDGVGDLRAVTASWAAAEREVNALATAWDLEMTTA